MLFDQLAHIGFVLLVHLLQENAILVAELGIEVKHIRKATTHAGSEVRADLAEHDHEATGHVLATVVACAFNNGSAARVAHGEALGGDAGHEGRAACRTVERRVASKDGLMALERRLTRLVDDQPASAEALANVVIGVALKLERDTRREEVAKGLARAALEVHVDRVVGQALCAKAARELEAEDATDGPVNVADGHVAHIDSLLALKRGRSAQHELPVENVRQLMVLWHAAVHRGVLVRGH
mmetsp:Transcript_84330/g.217162  ORF Transcript_84330/g.217162 Transcript_84330/m.217162 type:complete len:241 (+) Transcript_84330:2188-2910(+)